MPNSRQDRPRILFIDAYDSFSNNISSLLETELDASVHSIKINDPALSTDEALHKELRHYAAVVCGPGPGRPDKQEDVGAMSRIWRLGDEDMLPVLGICLGFQSLCLEFGAQIRRLQGPQHGIIRTVNFLDKIPISKEPTIFANIEEINATLYQSLCVDIGQDSISTDNWESRKWQSPAQCPDLQPLAWVESDDPDPTSGVIDKRVLVGVKHRTHPFWALQYHPESICTNTESRKVIRNWFRDAKNWNSKTKRSWSNDSQDLPLGKVMTRESLLNHMKHRTPFDQPSLYKTLGTTFKFKSELGLSYHSRTTKLPEYISVPDIVESVENLQQDHILLESSNASEISIGTSDVKNRYSIVGLNTGQSLRIEYTCGSNFVTVKDPQSHENFITQLSLLPYGGIWGFLAHFMAANRIASGLEESPFWGGFMGFTTYEMGLEGIEVNSEARKATKSPRPDLCFAWVTRSLVVDHIKGLIYIQDLASNVSCSLEWMDDVTSRIEKLSLPRVSFFNPSVSSSHPLLRTRSANSSQTSLSTNSSFAKPQDNSAGTSVLSLEENKIEHDSVISIETPDDFAYESKVSLCQEHIKGGDAYELCLTDQTIVRRRRSEPYNSSSPLPIKSGHRPDSWHLYRTLRARQPAPFASFIRLGSLTFVSASPERFLTYTRQGACELRPMKGTVRRTPSTSTLAQATALLDIPKEKAENLMIVDLVRHDLHSVCGPGKVQVPRLMVVEEYRSVFQMVSVVQGQLQTDGGYSGLDVLAASLPPGSMTGAPKKRSCEILQKIESCERSLYSGVVGYMDVGGRGDWSVNIRCMFRWDDEDVVSGNETTEVWHIGAGGAVTALSTPVGEREEMLTKLSGILGVFR